jgi:hypothetical protein
MWATRCAACFFGPVPDVGEDVAPETGTVGESREHGVRAKRRTSQLPICQDLVPPNLPANELDVHPVPGLGTPKNIESSINAFVW